MHTLMGSQWELENQRNMPLRPLWASDLRIARLILSLRFSFRQRGFLLACDAPSLPNWHYYTSLRELGNNWWLKIWWTESAWGHNLSLAFFLLPSTQAEIFHMMRSQFLASSCQCHMPKPAKKNYKNGPNKDLILSPFFPRENPVCISLTSCALKA